MRRALMVLGLVLVATGILWPLLSRLPLGRLPGDFVYQRAGIRVYLPVTSALLISLLLSVLVWLFRR